MIDSVSAYQFLFGAQTISGKRLAQWRGASSEPEVISVNEDDHSMSSIRKHHHSRILRDFREDDLGFKVGDMAQRAFGCRATIKVRRQRQSG
jgi:hypothetical protein